jgi:hypothetical protein
MTKALGKVVESGHLDPSLPSVVAMTLDKVAIFAMCHGYDTWKRGQVFLVLTLNKLGKFA